MAAKYFFIAMILISLSLISCRQGEDLNTEEAIPTSAVDKALVQREGESAQSKDGQEYNGEAEIDEHSTSQRDTLVIGVEISDPPKSGTHWKVK